MLNAGLSSPEPPGSIDEEFTCPLRRRVRRDRMPERRAAAPAGSPGRGCSRPVALMPNGISGAPPQTYFALDKPYESNAYDLSEGKRLYSWFGCKACHSDGQGGAGPAFLDGWWYYGPEMVSIFASIRDGRPMACRPFATG